MFDWELVKQAIEKSSSTSAVYVGTDSKRKGDWISYVTVIVIHLDGNRGGIVFKDIEKEKAYQPSKEGVKFRLMTEVYKAAAAGASVKEWVGNRKFEVHLDINPDSTHYSNVAYTEAKGVIIGYLGIEPKFKPEAFAASSVADYDAVKRANSLFSRKAVRKERRRRIRSAQK